jgi:ElaB/YqjD/DUF883 family membrane-anchored ribosome-binding protein
MSDVNEAESRDGTGQGAAGAAAHLKEVAGEKLAGARDGVAGAIGAAREKVGTVYEGASGRAASAFEAVKDTGGTAYSAARDRASQARERTAAAVDENPAIAFIGGLALGAIIGALLPRSEREKAALGQVGERIRTAATDAALAAKEAGREKLNELGLSKDGAGEKVRGLIDTALAAASSAGGAAVDAVKQKGGDTDRNA